MSKPKLYLPIGIFGSGKSTWARQQDSNTKIVSGDNIRYMLNGGEYIYNERLEPTIINLLLDMAETLLCQGHDVILDECYCSLSIRWRYNVALRLHYIAELVAVVFPEKGMCHHVLDKVKKGLRGKTPEYWTRVYEEMMEIYQPFDPEEEEDYFGSVINV